MFRDCKCKPKKCDHNRHRCDNECCNFEEKFKVRVRCKVECIPLKCRKDYEEDDDYGKDDYEEDDDYGKDDYEEDDDCDDRGSKYGDKQFMYNFSKIKNRRGWN